MDWFFFLIIWITFVFERHQSVFIRTSQFSLSRPFRRLKTLFFSKVWEVLLFVISENPVTISTKLTAASFNFTKSWHELVHALQKSIMFLFFFPVQISTCLISWCNLNFTFIFWHLVAGSDSKMKRCKANVVKQWWYLKHQNKPNRIFEISTIITRNAPFVLRLKLLLKFAYCLKCPLDALYTILPGTTFFMNTVNWDMLLGSHAVFHILFMVGKYAISDAASVWHWSKCLVHL